MKENKETECCMQRGEKGGSNEGKQNRDTYESRETNTRERIHHGQAILPKISMPLSCDYVLQGRGGSHQGHPATRLSERAQKSLTGIIKMVRRFSVGEIPFRTQ